MLLRYKYFLQGAEFALKKLIIVEDYTSPTGTKKMKKVLALLIIALMFCGSLGIISLVSDQAHADIVVLMLARLPSSRERTSAIWDGSNAYVFGGLGNALLDEIVQYNTSTNTVTIMSARLPSPREETSVIWDGSDAYIFGGNSDDGFLDEIVRYTPSTDIITVMSAKLPTPRASTSAIWDGINAYIFGGGISNGSEILRYNPSTDTIITMSAKLPSSRWDTSAIWDGINVYIFGGNVGGYSLDEIIKYNPSTDTAKVLSLRLPSGRDSTSAIWNGNNAYIFGGMEQTVDYYSTILKYDISSDTINTMSSELPTFRVETSAIWNGKNAYIFGGWDGYGVRHDQIVNFNPDIKPPTFYGLQTANDLRLGGRVELTWDAAIDPSTPIIYNIYQSTAPGGQDFSSPNHTTEDLSCQIYGLINDRTYYFIVRVKDSANNEDENTIEKSVVPTSGNIDQNQILLWILSGLIATGAILGIVLLAYRRKKHTK